jgi:hypothetical protein
MSSDLPTPAVPRVVQNFYLLAFLAIMMSPFLVVMWETARCTT